MYQRLSGAFSSAILFPCWLFWSVCFATTSPAGLTQIIPDESLSNERSRLTENVVVQGGLGDRIEGGAVRGRNLFHSFQAFNVREGQRLYFANPTGIENILSRVTGNDVSDILGTLGVEGTANLFLMNPNGIIFGQGARLDVRGSFVGTTANAIGFGTQGVFSATSPETPALLTINPSAFLFNQLPIGNIVSRSIAPNQLESSVVGLQVPNGQALTLLGDNVTISGNGSAQPAGLHAWGGQIAIGAVSGVGTIGLNSDGSLSVPDSIPRADVLFDRALALVAFNGGGDLAITARNINVLNNSFLQAGIILGVGNTSNQAGNLTLNATEEIRVEQDSGLLNHVNAGTSGNAGNLSIVTDSLLVTGGSILRDCL